MCFLLFLTGLAPAALGHATTLSPNVNWRPVLHDCPVTCSVHISVHCGGLSPLDSHPFAAAWQSAACVSGLPLHQWCCACWEGSATDVGTGFGWVPFGTTQPCSPGPVPLPPPMCPNVQVPHDCVAAGSPFVTAERSHAYPAFNDGALAFSALASAPALAAKVSGIARATVGKDWRGDFAALLRLSAFAAAAGGRLSSFGGEGGALLAGHFLLALAFTCCLFSGALACMGGSSIGKGVLLAPGAARWRSAPPLLLRLCAFAFILGGAHAGCPGGAVPGNYCMGSEETPCPARSFCIGGSKAAVPCTFPENCAAAGLSAEPPSPRHLAMSVTCTNVIPQTASTFTSYGLIPTSGTFSFCTSAIGSSYINNAFQASLHVAPPGYRIVLAITQWNTESGYDKGTIFLTTSGASPTTTSGCSLSGVASEGISLFSGGTAGAGTPPESPLTSPYGGGIGLCFFSDSSEVIDGIGYSVTAQACPAGFFCPNNALSPTPCDAVRCSAAL